MRRKLSALTVGLLLSAVLTARDASAEWLTGSTFTIQGTNAPDNFSQMVTLAPGTTTIDNGNLFLTQTIYDVAGNRQWLDFYIRPSEGHGLAGNSSALWSVQATGLQISAPQPIGGYYYYFTSNGTAINPITQVNPFVSVVPNPVSPALGPVYEQLFTSTRTTSTNWGLLMAPYASELAREGMPPTAVNGFHFGMLLDPTDTEIFVGDPSKTSILVMDGAPVSSPEPSTIVSAGLGGLLVLGYVWHRRRQAQAAMCALSPII